MNPTPAQVYDIATAAAAERRFTQLEALTKSKLRGAKLKAAVARVQAEYEAATAPALAAYEAATKAPT